VEPKLEPRRSGEGARGEGDQSKMEENGTCKKGRLKISPGAANFLIKKKYENEDKANESERYRKAIGTRTHPITGG